MEIHWQTWLVDVKSMEGTFTQSLTWLYFSLTYNTWWVLKHIYDNTHYQQHSLAAQMYLCAFYTPNLPSLGLWRNRVMYVCTMNQPAFELATCKPEWTSLHDCTSWKLCPQDDGLCFSSASSPYINQHSTTVNGFACWPLTFFLGSNFSQPSPSILPSHLVTLLTFLLYWPTS
jgi:hypothetical protein